MTLIRWSAVFLLLAGFAQGPTANVAAQSPRADVSFSAVIETIEFSGVPEEMQKTVLERIDVRAGDMLTIEVRHRIARELGKVQKGMTFTYKPGAKSWTARLIIRADC